MDILLSALFWFLVLMGVISIITGIVNWIVARSSPNNDLYVVLTVKNQEDTVEGIIRSVVWQNLHSDRGGTIPQIVVIDLGSNDDTPKILNRLASDYKFVHITDRDGYMNWIKKMVE